MRRGGGGRGVLPRSCCFHRISGAPSKPRPVVSPPPPPSTHHHYPNSFNTFREQSALSKAKRTSSEYERAIITNYKYQYHSNLAQASHRVWLPPAAKLIARPCTFLFPVRVRTTPYDRRVNAPPPPSVFASLVQKKEKKSTH